MSDTSRYVGARYVPKFYENSLDPTSTDWEPNVMYEPLTVVTCDNNHTYISKKFVPDEVGSPADNAEYWLDQGSYNAYIQQLQDEIDDMNDGDVEGSLQNQIDVMNDGSISGSLQNQINNEHNQIIGNMQSRKFVLIGDSYADNYTIEGVDYVGWIDKLISQQNLTSDNVSPNHIYRSSGTGFWAPSGTMAWKAWLDSKAVDNDVTDVVFCGGDNDIAGALVSYDLRDAIIATIASAKAKFPNARIWCGLIAWDLSSGVTENFIAMRNTYYQVLPIQGVRMLNGVEYCLMDLVAMRMPSHPNNIGTTILAGAIANALCGGANHCYVRPKTLNKVLQPKCTAIGDLKYSICDNLLTIVSDPTKNYFDIALTDVSAMTADGSTAIALATVDNLPFANTSSNSFTIYCGSCVIKTTGGWGNGSCRLLYWNGYLEITLMIAGANNYSAIIPTEVRIPAFNTIIDLFRAYY